MRKEKKTAQKGNMAIVKRFLKGSVHFFMLAVIFTALTSLCDMLIPQIVRVTVDGVLGGKEVELPHFLSVLLDKIGGFSFLATHLVYLSAAILLVALVKVLSQYFFRVCNTKGAETLTETARNALFSHIQHLPYSWHMQNKTGDIIQRCTSDIDTMKMFVSEQMTSIFRIVTLLILSLIFMFKMYVPLAVIALVPMPIFFVLSLIFRRKTEPKWMEMDENEGKLSAVTQENLTGVRVVRAFGRENEERAKFHKQNEIMTTQSANLGREMSKFWSTSDLVSGIQSMVVILFGSYFCIQDNMTAGAFIAFLTYNSMLLWPINDLGRIITNMSKAGVSVGRIRYIMESPVEKDKEHTVKPDMNGDIVFDRVSFTYEGSTEPILKSISFTAKAGKTVGILGGTGSGKSTVCALLDKLYAPTAGSITVGGTDIADIDTGYLRANIGMVLQDPYLFSGTLKENIKIATENLSDDEMLCASKSAALHEAVENFTKSYETFVGERGITLSGGQKQRVAIARILAKTAPILIFDDSLSAVDTETDAKIRASLEKRFGSATVILISHRIQTLCKADEIIVLDKGEIAECGSPDELLRKGGIYKKIYDIQTGSEVTA